MSTFFSTCFIYLLLQFLIASSSVVSSLSIHSNSQGRKRLSIVTGANGYLGREIVKEIVENGNDDAENLILCLVRPKRVEEEEKYWQQITKIEKNEDRLDSGCSAVVKVLPYDMLDGGITLRNALEEGGVGSSIADGKEVTTDCCVYHVASVFTPTEEHEQMALDNVKGAEDLMRIVAEVASKVVSQTRTFRVVLTSSMAAVRGSGQTPLNGKFYTHEDWNTLSELGASWGSSYQWSKAESEKRSWNLAKKHNIPFVSLCPSFIFGPSSALSSSSETNVHGNYQQPPSKSFSLSFVGSWLRGEAPVQSRLCVDVRDVAKAHVRAGTLDGTIGQRFIISSEARISSEKMAQQLKRIAATSDSSSIDADKITCDTVFDGGAIKIGDKEVECSDRMKEFLGGLFCRSVEETMEDMAKSLLVMEKQYA